MINDASSKLRRRVIGERLCMSLAPLVCGELVVATVREALRDSDYGKSTLRFFAPSIISTEARGGAGLAASRPPVSASATNARARAWAQLGLFAL